MIYKEMIVELEKIGLTDAQRIDVLRLMHDGMDIRVTPRGFELDAGKMKIQTLNANGEKSDGTESVHTRNFVLEAEGINPLQVKSVTLPKFDYADTEILTIGVEFFSWVPEIPIPGLKKKAS